MTSDGLSKNGLSRANLNFFLILTNFFLIFCTPLKGPLLANFGGSNGTNQLPWVQKTQNSGRMIWNSRKIAENGSTEASTVWICAYNLTKWWPSAGCSLQLKSPWRLRRSSGYTPMIIVLRKIILIELPMYWM